MVIHLTKKLADKLKMSPSKATSVNEFLSWRANYIQGRGYRFVVFMNDASRFFLTDYMFKYQKILYIYDYGDGWLHQIEVENFIPEYYEALPILLSGEGDSPPEDIGGAGGFAEFLEIINNPKHEEYENMKNWVKDQEWEPFCFEKTARMVKNI